MQDTKYKFITTAYDPSPELELLAREGWEAISHSSAFHPERGVVLNSVLLKKDPPPYINRGPG